MCGAGFPHAPETGTRAPEEEGRAYFGGMSLKAKGIAHLPAHLT
jgi:hypothetical protein